MTLFTITTFDVSACTKRKKGWDNDVTRSHSSLEVIVTKQQGGWKTALRQMEALGTDQAPPALPKPDPTSSHTTPHPIHVIVIMVRWSAAPIWRQTPTTPYHWTHRHRAAARSTVLESALLCSVMCHSPSHLHLPAKWYRDRLAA